MFRILKYALMFFLGYYIIRKLFGAPQSPAQTKEFPAPADPGSSRSGGERYQQEGEYIDYEEIK